MVAGLAAAPRRGAVWKAVPGSSATVIVYECDLPFTIPRGSAIVQANSPTAASHEQYALVAAIPPGQGDAYLLRRADGSGSWPG